MARAVMIRYEEGRTGMNRYGQAWDWHDKVRPCMRKARAALDRYMGLV